MSALCQYRTVRSYKGNVRKAATKEQNELYFGVSALASATDSFAVPTIGGGQQAL